MPLTISVVMPSFNQADFLPRAIASVAAQTLAPVEHIILDPGSTDGSREIAAAASGVTFDGAPDKGQADAVSKGMRRARGDIIAWLNSDDAYYDELVFARVIEAFESEERPDIVYGAGEYVGREDEFLRNAYVVRNPESLSWRLAREVGILQPAAFIARSLVDRIGPVDPNLQFCMDYEFWIRAQKSGARFKRLDEKLALARYYEENKTLGRRGESLLEVIQMLKKHYGFAHFDWIERLAAFTVFGHDGILRNHISEGADRSAIAAKAAELNWRINGDYRTVSALLAPREPLLVGATSSLFQHRRVRHAADYATPVASDAPRTVGARNYKVGPQEWAFDKGWLESELARSDLLVERLQAERESDTCVLVGNGPSLNRVDLSALSDADVFVTNYAVFNKKLRSIAKFACVTNYLVAEQECEKFNLLEDLVMFAPYWLGYCLLPTPTICYLRSVGRPEFSKDYRENISWRSTVSFFAMQIAYALGYRKVLLVGFDHYYVQPQSAEGELISQQEDDPNHFDPTYFKNKVWQAADTLKMEEMYKFAKAAFEADEREIVNCTDGGHLEVFRRSDLDSELAGVRMAAQARRERDIARREALLDTLPTYVKSLRGLLSGDLEIEEQNHRLERISALYAEEAAQSRRARLRALKGGGRGGRCFIIGEGSGAERVDLSGLRAETTIVADSAASITASYDWAPTYHVLFSRSEAAKWSRSEIAPALTTRLAPTYLGDLVNQDEHTIFFDHERRPLAADCDEPTEPECFRGESASAACFDLALYFGFDEIYLLGFEAPADGENSIFATMKAMCESRGVRIVNLTRDCDLAPIPRGNLFSLLNCRPETPRLLLLDHTRIGDGTATGELKATLFAKWPAENLLQIGSIGPETLTLTHNRERMRGAGDDPDVAETIWSYIAAFDPEMILYRPVPGTDRLHSLAMQIIDETGLPYSVWIVDDWPTALAQKDPAAFARLDADLRRLLDGASRRFSICEMMSDAFELRYGVSFEAFANGVEPADWPRPELRRADAFRLRYAGSLAENMTLAALRLVAAAVERLAAMGRNISFEIKTRSLWYEQVADCFAEFPHTKFIVENLSRKNYRDWLSTSDAVVIAYNFDDESSHYVRYSLANKLPECMACGAPILAVGPPDVATLAYLEEIDCGVRVKSPDINAIVVALDALICDPQRRLALSERAQEIAFARHDVHSIRTSFMSTLSETPAPRTKDLLLPRSAHANVDETGVIAKLLGDRRGRKHVMLDVGAHHGSSAAHFDALGWTIYCFEPDPANRKKLGERYARARNVHIDPRALSDHPSAETAFFSSDESTGISGLHAFRGSHKECARVEVTTVAEFVAAQKLTHIDFLKIDAEGFDFLVLKGVPWADLQPDVIECEFEDAKTVPLGHTWREVADFLREKGYTVYVSEWHPVVRYGIAHDWRRVSPYPGASVSASAWGNLLAFRTDPGRQTIRRTFAAVVTSRNSALERARNVQTENGKNTSLVIEKSGRRAKIAEKLHRASPRLYSLLRFGKRILAHVWRRKAWTVPGALALAGLVAAGFHPAVSSFRYLMWVGAGFAAFGAGLAYLGFRMQTFVEQMLADGAARKTDIAALRTQVAALDERLSGLQNRQLAAIEARLLAVNAVHARINDRIKGANERIRDVEARRTRTDARLGKIERLANERMVSIESRVLEVAKLLQGLLDRSNELSKSVGELSGLSKSVIELREASPASLKTDLAQARKEFNLTGLANSRFYQRFNRNLEDQHIAELTKVWGRRLSLKLSKEVLGYQAHRACLIESLTHGRLAASIEDVILRTIVAMGVKGRKVEVLEIGTLFGTGSAIIYDALSARVDSVHLTLLDPLDGYYAMSPNDGLTGEPVTEEMLWRNFEIAGIPRKDVTLIKKLSSEPEALAAAKKRQYDLMIIDGDHSYAGVKTDFENYSPFVRPGGYIIFDDYDSPDWPEVKAYVDAEVASAGHVARVGNSWRTCVYRVVRGLSEEQLEGEGDSAEA